MVAYVVFITCGGLFLYDALPTKDFCLEINKIAKPGQMIIKYAGEQPRQEIFYLNNPLKYITDKDELTKALDSKENLIGLTQDGSILSTSAKVIRIVNGNFLFSN